MFCDYLGDASEDVRTFPPRYWSYGNAVPRKVGWRLGGRLSGMWFGRTAPLINEVSNFDHVWKSIISISNHNARVVFSSVFM